MIQRPVSGGVLRRGAVRVRHALRRALPVRLRPSCLIVLYHRIAELPSDPQLLAVTPQHFAEHLELLRAYGRPMSLRELPTALREGTLPDRSVAVTLDDGYADNLENAKPLLERYEVPATVFVTTAHLGQQREFWWDDLERLLLLPGRLPATLRLRIGRTAHEWHLGDADVYSEAESRRHADWNVESEDPTRRHRAYRDLCRRLRGVPGTVRDAVLDELRETAGVSSPGRPTHQTLSPEGVVHLTEGGVVDVGAHTVTHPVLSALPIAMQRAEIAESNARLQEITGREISSFAYPFGGRADYTPATVALVRETGFSLACSNVHGLVRRGSDRFQLPRELVRDWDGETFARRLREWLGG